MRQCMHCRANIPYFVVAHVCPSGKYAPKLPTPPTLPNAEDKYAFVLKLCAHISGCAVEQVDAQIVKVMSEQPMESTK